MIPVGVYTHINVAFAVLDPTSFEVKPLSSSDPTNYKKITDLKKQDPNLKVFIAIGGGEFSQSTKTSDVFPRLVAADAKQQQAFFDNLLAFMSKYNFDGVDLDWEYPVNPERDGKSSAEKNNFSTFVASLNDYLKKNGKPNSVSMAIPSPPYYLRDGYDFPALVSGMITRSET